MVTMNEVLGKKNVQNVMDDLYKNESNKKIILNLELIMKIIKNLFIIGYEIINMN